MPGNGWAAGGGGTSWGQDGHGRDGAKQAAESGRRRRGGKGRGNRSEIVVCRKCDGNSWARVSRALWACQVCDTPFDYDKCKTTFNSPKHWELRGWKDYGADRGKNASVSELLQGLIDHGFGGLGGTDALQASLSEAAAAEKQQQQEQQPQEEAVDMAQVWRTNAQKLEAAKNRAQKLRTQIRVAEEEVQKKQTQLDEAVAKVASLEQHLTEAELSIATLEADPAAGDSALPQRASSELAEMLTLLRPLFSALQGASASGPLGKRASASSENTCPRAAKRVRLRAKQAGTAEEQPVSDEDDLDLESAPDGAAVLDPDVASAAGTWHDALDGPSAEGPVAGAIAETLGKQPVFAGIDKSLVEALVKCAQSHAAQKANAPPSVAGLAPDPVRVAQHEAGGSSQAPAAAAPMQVDLGTPRGEVASQQQCG